MARKKAKITYTYKCSITDQKFVRTKKINDTDELISVKAYYELNPENDDRPEKVKKELQLKEEASEPSLEDFFGSAQTDETEQ